MKFLKTVILFSLIVGSLMPANVWAGAKGKEIQPAQTLKKRFKRNVSKTKKTIKKKLSKDQKSATMSDASKKQSKPGVFARAKNWAKKKKATATTFMAAGLMATSPKARKKAFELIRNNPKKALATGILGAGAVTSENLDTVQDVLDYALIKTGENPKAAAVLASMGIYGLVKVGKKAIKAPEYTQAVNAITPIVTQNVSKAKGLYNAIPGPVKFIGGLIAQNMLESKVREFMGMDEQNQDPEAQFYSFINIMHDVERLHVPANSPLFGRLEAVASSVNDDLAKKIQLLRQQYPLIKGMVDDLNNIPQTPENQKQIQELSSNFDQLAPLFSKLTSEIIEQSYMLFGGQEGEPMAESQPANDQLPIEQALSNPELRQLIAQNKNQPLEQSVDDDIPYMDAVRALAKNGDLERIDDPSLASMLQDPNFGADFQEQMNNPEFQEFMRNLSGQQQSVQNEQTNPQDKQTVENNARAHVHQARPQVKDKSVAQQKSSGERVPYINPRRKRQKDNGKKLRRLPRELKKRAKGRRHIHH